MRWWRCRLHFNPVDKSRKARRWVPLSQRVFDVLRLRAANGSEWVFQSRRAAEGHLTIIAGRFRAARARAAISKPIVLYHARHAFGTYAMAETKNPALVRDVMGHADLRTTMIYQHPELEPLRDAIDHRNQRVM